MKITRAARVVLVAIILVSVGSLDAVGQGRPAASHDRELAESILSNPKLTAVLNKARNTLKTGLNAGDGYGEIWIRDLNTFIELALDLSFRTNGV